MGKKEIGIFILIFVGIFISVGFLSATANTTTKSSTLTNAINESISTTTGSNAAGQPYGAYGYKLTHGCPYATWRSGAKGECDLQILAAYNGSFYILQNIVDYNVTTTATCTGNNQTQSDIRFYNGNVTNTKVNTTYVTYKYCDDDYVVGSANKSILGLIILFGAIGILIFVIVVVLKGNVLDMIAGLQRTK